MALIAFIIFTLALFGVHAPFSLLYAGLACMALWMLIGNWPFGYFINRT